MTQHYNRHSERDKRRSLRNNPTDAEQELWQHLKRKQVGAKFRRQYSVDAFVLDFYAPQLKLGIEVDGDSHTTAEATEYDRERTVFLNGFGIRVLRFTNREICESIDAVVDVIEKAVACTTSP